MDSNADHLADRDLVRAVLRGESSAVDALVQRLRCIPRILALLNQRVGGVLGPEDMNDLTQDTLVRLWPRMENYTGQAALETWFYGFCFNGFMNALRKGSRAHVLDSLSEQVASPDGPPAALDYDHVHRGLEQLGELETRVIRLKYFDDLTFEEIGARLGISPNTAKTRYYRGMRKLEELLRRGREEVER
jgi:RNA polymerase sigma-70 factor (ECF subfamily)